MTDEEWATVRRLVETTVATTRATGRGTSAHLDVGDWTATISTEHYHSQIEAKTTVSFHLPREEALRAQERDNEMYEAQQREKAERVAEKERMAAEAGT